MVLARAANMSLANFLEEHIWTKAGFEGSATWALDNDHNRRELAFGVLSMTTRDWARFGWLMLNRGAAPSDGARIVSEEWVHQASTPDAPHLMPNSLQTDSPSFGYGFQWWVPPRDDNPSAPSQDILALGVYGQMVYVSREHGIVVAKNAANPNYKTMARPGFHENFMQLQGHAALKAVAMHMARRVMTHGVRVRCAMRMR